MNANGQTSCDVLVRPGGWVHRASCLTRPVDGGDGTGRSGDIEVRTPPLLSPECLSIYATPNDRELCMTYVGEVTTQEGYFGDVGA